MISFFGGGGGPSPFEPESADPLSAAVSDASATAKEAQHSLDPLAMFPGMGHAGADVAVRPPPRALPVRPCHSQQRTLSCYTIIKTGQELDR